MRCLSKKVIAACCNLPLFFVIIFFCSAENSFAQYCTGATFYTVRDERGAKMSNSQLKKVVIKQINGYEPTRGKTAQGQDFYRVDYYGVEIIIYFKNPLWVGNCGEINDLTLQYKNKTMKLYIGQNRDNWTRFFIDSLPFQEGVFQLQKKLNDNKGVLPCEVPKTAETGIHVCNVSANNWLNLGKNKA